MAEKIRCSECGNIIAFENEPINDRGEISIMCNNRKPNGKRCKTINIITRRLSGESEKENGLYYCDRLKVYGMVSGQCGWTEKYGWIEEGSWCKYINGILEKSLFFYEQNKKKAEANEKQRKIEEREKIEKRAKEFEKFFR